MVDWLKNFGPDILATIIDEIHWGLTLIAVVAGLNGFRMSIRIAMDVIKLSGENRRLKAELAQLKIEMGNCQLAKPSWE